MSGATLVIGVLLVLTWALGSRLPLAATFGPGGLGEGALGGAARPRRDPIRAFLLSPVHPATWSANVSLLVGLATAVVSFAFVASMFSAGASTLFALIGLIFIAVIAFIVRRSQH